MRGHQNDGRAEINPKRWFKTAPNGQVAPGQPAHFRFFRKICLKAAMPY
jgi:hypothetical protein